MLKLVVDTVMLQTSEENQTWSPLQMNTSIVFTMSYVHVGGENKMLIDKEKCVSGRVKEFFRLCILQNIQIYLIHEKVFKTYIAKYLSALPHLFVI